VCAVGQNAIATNRNSKANARGRIIELLIYAVSSNELRYAAAREGESCVGHSGMASAFSLVMLEIAKNGNKHSPTAMPVCGDVWIHGLTVHISQLQYTVQNSSAATKDS
jgi:hypothetical protein